MGASDVGKKGGGDFGGSSGVGRFSISCRFKNVVDQFEWEFTGVYGPNSDGTEDYYGMSYLVFAVSGIFLGVWEETLMLCGFPLND